jgi:putative acetyltransferase
MPLRLRPYTPADADATLVVFRRAVRTTAAHDYSPEQVAAWAPDDLDAESWGARRSARATVVADVDGRVVGFTDVDATGYLDMLYVDPDAGRRGVATALLDWALEEAGRAGADTVRTHASITARPFFEARGFRVDEVRRPVRNGVVLVNFAMSRPIGSVADAPDPP